MPSNLDAERRMAALDFAVKTVVNSRQFTVSQVVNTAHVYEQYISDGTVPPVTLVPGAQRNVNDEPEPQPQQPQPLEDDSA